MKAGVEKDYKFGSKNNYRRWLWNRIAERTHDKKNALILYLPGIQNIDGVIAASKGFKQNNMIAVERDKQAIKQLRKLGVNTIKGEAVDIVSVWSERNPLDIIYFDFCSGLNAQAMALLKNLHTSYAINQFPKYTVICLNFLRGRDTHYGLGHDVECLPQTHRGAQFLTGFTAWGAIKNHKESKMKWMHARELRKHVNPEYNSYKSGNVYMDSIIFTWMLAKKHRGNFKIINRDEKTFKTYQHRISAALAHRTMRNNN